MINFSNFSREQANELFSIIQKSIEKSEMEKFYLFTQDDTEKAKIFVWGHRFLCNVHNLIEDGVIKTEVKNEIDLTKKRYNDILAVLADIKHNKLLVFRLESKLFNLVNQDSQVNDLIDSFSVFIERDTINSMSKLKGFVLEGKSGKEFKKIFSAKKGDLPVVENGETFEEMTEDSENEEPEEKEEVEDVEG